MFCGIVFVFLGKILSRVGKHAAAGVFFGNLAFIAADARPVGATKTVALGKRRHG